MWKNRLMSLSLAVTLANLVGGCGGDGQDPAPELQGLWIIESITLDNNGTPETLTRDGSTRAVRADMVVTATGQATVSMDSRLAQLVRGVMVGEAILDTQSAVIEDGKMIISDGQSVVTVFDHVLSDDKLSLTFDANDARNTATDPPLSVRLARIAPWDTSSVGSWDIVSMTSDAAGTVFPDTCQEMSPGQVWGKNVMTVVISARHVFERTANLQTYSDAACTMPDQSGTDVQGGIVEERGNKLSIWTFSPQSPDSSEYLEFTMVVAGDQMTLTRTSCVPVATCVANSATEVVIRKTN